jgi:hypothetical protein
MTGSHCTAPRLPAASPWRTWRTHRLPRRVARKFSEWFGVMSPAQVGTENNLWCRVHCPKLILRAPVALGPANGLCEALCVARGTLFAAASWRPALHVNPRTVPVQWAPVWASRSPTQCAALACVAQGDPAAASLRHVLHGEHTESLRSPQQSRSLARHGLQAIPNTHELANAVGRPGTPLTQDRSRTPFDAGLDLGALPPRQVN